MNSKSSKSVLCCEPCQSISILRIVWRLLFSFIFERATIAFSVTLYDCLLHFFENDREEQKTTSIDLSRSEQPQIIQYCQYCAVNIVRPSRSLELFPDYRCDTFFPAWNISSLCFVWTMLCSPGIFLKIMVKGVRRFPLKYSRSDWY